MNGMARPRQNRLDSFWLRITPDPDRTYVDACRTLEVRPLRRQLAALNRRIKEQDRVMTPEDFDALMLERARLTREIATRLPEELLKRSIRRGDVDAR